MRLADLFVGSPAEGDLSAVVEILDVHHDSRRVQPGSLFVALPGSSFDGRHFVQQAVESGAVAVLAAGPPLGAVAVPWVVTENPRALMATLAARVHGHPEQDLDLVGVTGTNGKSTLVWVLERVFAAAGFRAGRIGTQSSHFEDFEQLGARTTPESPDLYRILGTMREAGAEVVSMEVSSHALSCHRVDGLLFKVAVFTNLTQDHLDFHADLEDYFQAKKRLFQQLRNDGTAVVHVGDPFGRDLADSLPKVITCGPGGQVAVEESSMDLTGIRATLSTPRGPLRVVSNLLGAYNLENLCTVVAVAEALGLSHDSIQQGISESPIVPGRMELVGQGDAPVFIDYAHTPEALAATLSSVRSLTSLRLAVVFGCGGDRDTSKRPMMGSVAGSLADLPIVTSDNSRSEDPVSILAAVEEGLVASGNRSYRLLPDRRDAIRRALDVTGEGWVVVVAGKGDETGQESQGVVRPFSDREEILKALEERHGVRNGG